MKQCNKYKIYYVKVIRILQFLLGLVVNSTFNTFNDPTNQLF
jgi:hypothetical protein